MMAPWLIEHLRNIGALNPDRIGRRAKAQRCPRCSTLTLVGLDADRCAFAVRVDVDPIGPVGEILATFADRRTYAVRGDGANLELNARGQFEIQGTPAGVGDYDVVAAHVCGADVLPTIPSKYQPSTRRQELPDAAPF